MEILIDSECYENPRYKGPFRLEPGAEAINPKSDQDTF